MRRFDPFARTAPWLVEGCARSLDVCLNKELALSSHTGNLTGRFIKRPEAALAVLLRNKNDRGHFYRGKDGDISNEA